MGLIRRHYCHHFQPKFLPTIVTKIKLSAKMANVLHESMFVMGIMIARMLPMNRTAVSVMYSLCTFCGRNMCMFKKLTIRYLLPLNIAFRCQPNEFQCEINNKCILKIWRCDGEIDCSADAADSSDEKHCGKYE